MADFAVFQDSTGSTSGLTTLSTLNSFPLQTKLAEKRKIIEEIAHNDVKKVSATLSISRAIIALAGSLAMIYVALFKQQGLIISEIRKI